MKTIEARRGELQGLLDELEVIQKSYAGKSMPTEVGERFDTLAAEAESMQNSIDDELKRTERFDDLAKWGGKVDDPTLPVPGDDFKGGDDVAGYMTLGEFVVMQKAVADFVERGAPQGQTPRVELAHSLSQRVMVDGKAFVPVTRNQRKEIHELVQTKAVPSIGTGVVDPTRLPGITQLQKDRELGAAALFSQGTTSSDQVEYVRRNATTRAAAETAHGGSKPESAFTFDLATAPVRTIAVHMPVQTQQLADWGQLRSEIDNFLLYDLGARKEEQVMYGDGVAPNLEGILDAGVGMTDISANGRYVGTVNTLIDAVQMGINDVLVSNYRPSAVVMHPFDWETILLEKATDNQYIWTVVPSDNGSRLWGLPVVVTQAAQANRGDTTEERNIVVADWNALATVVDRMQAAIMVGMINAQFTSNLRTILAEERLAFAIRAPLAGAYLQTVAPVV